MESISWRKNAPYSARFDDIYFNPQDGLAETQHVFLNGNRLQERFAACRQFTIAELGFGTGLNCLAAWELFERVAPPDARLYYIGFERYPLPVEAMRRAVAPWPKLAARAETLLTHLPPLAPESAETSTQNGDGPAYIQRLNAGRLSLTLVPGDASTALPAMDFAADAWFLDGFAPAKNPALWAASLLHAVGRHTAPQGTAASFTVAGHVRRGLAEAGFVVEKAPGFGRKREMTAAYMACSVLRERGAASVTAPIPPEANPSLPGKAEGIRTALIIGGGIAGCSAAAALARRGMAVTLLEAGANPASGATGNPAGALYPRLSTRWSPGMRFYWAALCFMHAQLPRLLPDYTPCGMLKLPIDATEEAKLRTLATRLGLSREAMRWLEADDASSQAGVTLTGGALWLPMAGMADGAALCRRLSESVTTMCNTEIMAISPSGTGWRAGAQSGETFEADIVVLANAAHMLRFAPAARLPLRWDRGQLSYVRPHAASPRPRCILSHKGYALPLPDGRLLLGATHGRGETDCTVRVADHAENLALTRRYLPHLLDEQADACGGRAALRCNAPDHLPLVGELAAGLYVSTGHGSRGLLSAPFAADILADLIGGTAPPVDREVLAAIAPARFADTSPCLKEHAGASPEQAVAR